MVDVYVRVEIRRDFRMRLQVYDGDVFQSGDRARHVALEIERDVELTPLLEIAPDVHRVRKHHEVELRVRMTLQNRQYIVREARVRAGKRARRLLEARVDVILIET